jgi:hypothetical protein
MPNLSQLFVSWSTLARTLNTIRVPVGRGHLRHPTELTSILTFTTKRETTDYNS